MHQMSLKVSEITKTTVLGMLVYVANSHGTENKNKGSISWCRRESQLCGWMQMIMHMAHDLISCT